MVVQIRMLGINEVIRRLQDSGKQINQGADFGVVRAGAFIEEEVKESIAGNRAEPRSVKTGLFANSIEFDKISEGVGVVKSKPTQYPDSNLTTADIAEIMENKRHHFANTNTRNKLRAKEIIAKEIKNKL
jgi:hypothetical protein